MILQSKPLDLEESFVDPGYDMEKVWAYLTIKDLINNKTTIADSQVCVRQGHLYCFSGLWKTFAGIH